MTRKRKPPKHAAKRQSSTQAIVMVPTQVEGKNPSPNLMAKAKPVYVVNESPVIPVGNEEHYFRVADLQKTWRRPPEQVPAEIFPKFREEDGRKYLIENSANTATCVRFGYPPLEYEARYAMEWSQQAREEGKRVSVEAIKEKFPTIDYFANQKEVSELVTSEPGHPDSGKWAIGVFARAFQKPPTTISKYARTDPYNKRSMNREKVLPRRTR